MSATMARQGHRVQLEQSNMHLALSLAKTAKGGFSKAAIAETQYLMKKTCAEVQGEKMQGVDFLGYRAVMAAIERHPGMHQQNQTNRCLHCQHGTVQNPHTHWSRKGMGAPQPGEHRQPTPETMPSPPGTPPGPP